MTDYTSRADEMLKQVEALQPAMTEEAGKRLREAIATYMAKRKSSLDELLTIVGDDSESNKEQANRWRDRCNSARSEIAPCFDNAIKGLTLAPEIMSAGSNWISATIAAEDKFFETLSTVNAASTRDYLVANRLSLKEYTQALDGKWKKILGESDRLHGDEHKIYLEALELVKTLIKEMAATEKTVQEQFRAYAQKVLDITKMEKGADFLAMLVDLKLPHGSGAVIKAASQRLAFFNQLRIENHPAFQQRIKAYEALMQAEKGGILPLFKETRKEVHEYWEKNGAERAREMLKQGQSSLDSWLSACPTSAQKDDAKRFYDEACSHLKKHIDATENVAKDFESKWNGVFKGPLATDNIEKLVDGQRWQMNARTLVEAATFSNVEAFASTMNGYYEVSIEDPLSALQSTVDNLPEGVRAEAARVLDGIKQDIKDEIQQRLKTVQEQGDNARSWFNASAIEKSFDREALKDEID